MAKILLIGKDLPDSKEFAQALSGLNHTIYTVSNNIDVDYTDQNIYCTSWNKSSAISTHSLLIKAETRLEQLEQIIFYFDSDYFGTQFTENRSEEISSALDAMVTPYLYATCELLKRIEQKKQKITVGFLVKNHETQDKANIVNVAEAAFCQLAENFATNVATKDYLRVLLAKSSAATETCGTEAQIAQWFSTTLDTVSEAKKHSAKQAASWNKAGGKLQTGFPFFK